MDIHRKTIKRDVDALVKKLESFNFFRSRFEVPYRAWTLTESAKAFQDFYLALKSDPEFSGLVRDVNRHGAEKLTTSVIWIYAKTTHDPERKQDLEKFLDMVVQSARGKQIDKDYVGGKMRK